MALIDMVQQQLGQSQINQIGEQLGIDPSIAANAISAALPMILGGMARHASQPDGAATVQQTISEHGGAAMPDLSGAQQGGMFNNDASESGSLLGRIFGAHHDTVQQGVQQTSGLDADKSKKLLLMLAPVVLGVLARRRFGGQSSQDAEPGQVAATLQQEARTVSRLAPHMGGILGKLLAGIESAGT